MTVPALCMEYVFRLFGRHSAQDRYNQNPVALLHHSGTALLLAYLLFVSLDAFLLNSLSACGL